MYIWQIPVDKVIELPEIREQVEIKEVPVDRYVDCPVAEYVDVPVYVDVKRNLPVPVQAVTTMEYKLPVGA